MKYESMTSLENENKDGKVQVIKTSVFIIEGMTCTNCSTAIENHIGNLAGVTKASVSLLTNKATVQYIAKTIGIRKIIEEIEDLGFGAKFENQSTKSDIRVIL